MNRTVQFFGQGYGPTPANIVVKMDDSVIFSGPIPTIDQIGFNTAPEDQVLLFTCELPIDFEGFKPMTIEVLEGTVVFAHIYANHCFQPNGKDQYFAPRQGVDARANVKINGEPQTQNLNFPGATLSWTVPVGCVFSYDLNVAPGTQP